MQQSFAPTLRYMIVRIVKELKKLKCKEKSLDKIVKVWNKLTSVLLL